MHSIVASCLRTCSCCLSVASDWCGAAGAEDEGACERWEVAAEASGDALTAADGGPSTPAAVELRGACAMNSWMRALTRLLSGTMLSRASLLAADSCSDKRLQQKGHTALVGKCNTLQQQELAMRAPGLQTRRYTRIQFSGMHSCTAAQACSSWLGNHQVPASGCKSLLGPGDDCQDLTVNYRHDG